VRFISAFKSLAFNFLLLACFSTPINWLKAQLFLRDALLNSLPTEKKVKMVIDPFWAIISFYRRREKKTAFLLEVVVVVVNNIHR
jgi:hypothetical protein